MLASNVVARALPGIAIADALAQQGVVPTRIYWSPECGWCLHLADGRRGRFAFACGHPHVEKAVDIVRRHLDEILLIPGDG